MHFFHGKYFFTLSCYKVYNFFSRKTNVFLFLMGGGKTIIINQLNNIFSTTEYYIRIINMNKNRKKYHYFAALPFQL